ncbi:hypothetical protein E1265_05030 [Streptomyces sp. 8K308]|uniref:EboA domain-containing protein n=1 Tax=Streptomyces sp. 8K308 TaxID=2530388 RepID=UPI001051549B|nr:EboA domain-containing protein [Streptomyces sp. 8K308]TDC26181.1 hypothetical protein E1265_05030 [Streptomyces sp. 8K308]
MSDEQLDERFFRLATEVAGDPTRLPALFPAVGRLVGRGPTDPGDPDGLRVPRIEDRARAALVAAVAASSRLSHAELAMMLTELYEDGDADEKRGVLRALDDVLDTLGLLGLVEDGLRSNDPRLVAAAMGRYADRHLGADGWRHGVLKCLFVGVPLDAVAAWTGRVDDELARMTAAFVAERESAGRTVPEDARRILALNPRAAEGER